MSYGTFTKHTDWDSKVASPDYEGTKWLAKLVAAGTDQRTVELRRSFSSSSRDGRGREVFSGNQYAQVLIKVRLDAGHEPVLTMSMNGTAPMAYPELKNMHKAVLEAHFRLMMDAEGETA